MENWGVMPKKKSMRRKPRLGKNLHSTWSPLCEGDIVDLVAPGFAPKLLEIRAARNYIRSLGLRPRLPQDLVGNDVLCSNSDEKRFSFLKQALLDRKSKAIWCLRGGYGANRLLPYLQELKAPDHAKVVVGYSDVTSLHLFLNQVWKWNTLHGPLLDRFARGEGRPRDEKELLDCLFGVKTRLEYRELRPLNKLAAGRGQLGGSITGGNLTTWVSAIGTPWAGQAKGRILFFEDIGEQARKVDRMLVQIQQSGGFQGVKAVILGDFVGGAESNGSFQWKKVLRRFAEESNFPVFHRFPLGHGQKQRPLPFGPKAVLRKG
ncbi:MAG: LD-carboxypeptidase, partial [Bdellovibrionales bacterium]|nr:LD-carboxypeptidase [Bdellovibrionales bacterium]